MSQLPEPCAVTVYHRRAPLDPSQPDDVFVSGGKVTLIRSPNDKHAPSAEFEFARVLRPDAPPEAATAEALRSAVSSAKSGVNALLLALGHSHSGKAELVHGMDVGAGGLASAGSSLAEGSIKALFDEIAPHVDGRPTKVSMRFVNVSEERVQDLLRPDSHAHNLQLDIIPSSGVEVVGAPFRPVGSEAIAMQLYQQGKGELRRLDKFHGMDTANATNLLTLSLSMPLAGEAVDKSLHRDATPATTSSVTIVELPGVEGLVEGAAERAQLLMTKGAHSCRGIIDFAEVVSALADRHGPQHVPRRGSKVSILLSELLGANARVHAIATVVSGMPQHSAQTLRLASLLRRVLCYPLVNSPATHGLLAIARSENLALRDLQGHDSGRQAKRSHELNAKSISEMAGGAPSDNGGRFFNDGEIGASGLETSSKEARDLAIEESNMEGKMIRLELEKEQLKEARVRLVKEKEDLRAKCDALIAEKRELEKLQIDSEAERLNVAKALVELEIEGNVKESERAMRVEELEGKLEAEAKAKKSLETANKRLRNEVEELKGELELAQGEKEDLVNELIAVRLGLEQTRGQLALQDESASERQKELAAASEESERRGMQLEELGTALDLARNDAQQSREAHAAAQARVAELETEFAALTEKHSQLAAKLEETTLQLEREQEQNAYNHSASVQQQLKESTLSSERSALQARQEQIEEDLRRADAKAKQEAESAIASAHENTRKRSQELTQARLQLEEQRHLLEEERARSSSLEKRLDSADRRLQAAHEQFRDTIRQLLGQQVPASNESSAASKHMDELATSLREAVISDLEARERFLLKQLEDERKENQQLFALTHAPDKETKAEPEALESSVSAPGAAPQFAGAPADMISQSAMSSKSLVKRSEKEYDALESDATSLRKELEKLRGKLLQSANEYETAARSAAEERAQSERRVLEVRAAADKALQALEQDGNTASMVAKSSERALQAQADLRNSIQGLKDEQALERKRQEEATQLAAANDEVRKIRRENETLRSELARASLGATRELSLLKTRVREMDGLFGSLEAERSSLARRAFGAEEQLVELQNAMATNMARYQREILRLRAAIHK
ncbi:hypothetical protein AB1Y20_023621 [Prymnesium parvum]|uniref:Kinesin motor domain-containing protein n=1 Tax=Prymnesium parvum TaxID=97485 RepID=A0AB34JGW7_PRYPA